MSLWKNGVRTHDYKFFDKNIRGIFDAGGTTVNVHKYLGAPTTAATGNATVPVYSTVSEQNIQDLLFLENRDRKYDTSVFEMRGIYSPSDIDFDLSQFGLFLSNDTLFIVLHLNDMVETLGRKIMAGDVIELPHLRDFYPLDTTLGSLKRYYKVDDASRASEGYSPTWLPHLWRIKCTPIVDSQEYSDILSQDAGNGNTLKDLLSTYTTEIAINDAIITQAIAEVPKAGYDVSKYYTLPVNEDGSPKQDKVPTADSSAIISDNAHIMADTMVISPTQSGYDGYLLGDQNAPNGYPVVTGIEFPLGANEGDFCLRLDYVPNRMFRFDGKKWVKVQDNVRTPQLPHTSTSQRSGFINDTKTTYTSDGQLLVERQSLSQALRPKAD